MRGLRTSRDQVRSGAERLAVDGEGVLVQEARLPGADFEAVGVRDVGVLRLAQLPDRCVLLPDEGAQVDPVGAPLKCPVRARWRAPAAASNVFDGTHPTFTHVPPSTPCSMSTTVTPAWRAVIAAAVAAPPDPITARSTFCCSSVWFTAIAFLVAAPIARPQWTVQCGGRSRDADRRARCGNADDDEDTALLPVRWTAPDAPRTAGGYRDYEPASVERLDFIRRGGAAGLTLAQMREVLALRDAGNALATMHTLEARLRTLDEQIAELAALRDTAAQLGARAQDPDPSSCDAASACRYL